MAKIISARYESDAGGVDATAIASSLAEKGDFFCVGSAFGDPFPGRKKTLKVKYEFGGREYDDAVGEWDMFVPRPYRVEGVPGGRENFEIEWAGYGGERFIDFTEEARKWYVDPFAYCSIFDFRTEPKTKGYAWGDPHPGIRKHYVVKFHYHGRVYVSTMKDPDARQRLVSPVFSVIIPTWNRAPFLKRCVGSVLEQDFDPSLVETVVVDDGSTDDTSRVMAEICTEHPRVLYVRIQHTGCCGLVRNKGVAVSSGAYIAYLDSDDKYKPNHLSAAFKRFQESRAYLLRTWSDFCTLKLENGVIREAREEDFNHRLYGRYAVYPSCLVHRRELLAALGRQVPFIAREGEDVMFAADARALETSLGIPEEAIEERTVIYGLIVGGDNLSYERPEVAAAYRDRNE
jgi:hypothetical protein